MAFAHGDIYHVAAFLDGITLIYLEASTHFFKKIVETYRLQQPSPPRSVRHPGLWVPAEDIDGIWPFLSICDLRHLPTTPVLLRNEYRVTTRSDLLCFWQQMEQLLSTHCSLPAQLRYHLTSTLFYHLFVFTDTESHRPDEADEARLWVGSPLPPSPSFEEALFTAQISQGTMIFMLDFYETWLSTVERRLGILDIEGEGVQDVARLDAVCLFDISVELVCEVNDPGVAIVPTTSAIHDLVRKGEPIPFVFNLSIPDTPIYV